jgi:hypothetical protein
VNRARLQTRPAPTLRVPAIALANLATHLLCVQSVKGSLSVFQKVDRAGQLCINDLPHEPSAGPVRGFPPIRLVDYRVKSIVEKALFWVATGAVVPSTHLRRCGPVSPLAAVDVGRVVALLGEVGHEGMIGR